MSVFKPLGENDHNYVVLIFLINWPKRKYDCLHEAKNGGVQGKCQTEGRNFRLPRPNECSVYYASQDGYNFRSVDETLNCDF